MNQHRLRSIFHAAIAVIHFLISAFFAYLFYIRYWKYRDCIAAARSSCITPEGVSLIEGGSFWIVPASIFASLGLFWFLKALRKRRI